MIRRFILWLLLISFLWVLFHHLREINDLGRSLSNGKWVWVIAALLLQVLYYSVFTASYWAAFHTVEVSSHWHELLPVTYASTFINVLMPLAGASGMALFVDDARHRGQSTSKTAAGVLLQLIADFSSFTLVLAIGLGYLFSQNDLQNYEIVTAAILLFATFGLSLFLGLGLLHPASLLTLFMTLQKTIDKTSNIIRRRPFFSADWADRTSEEFADAAFAVVQRPLWLIRTAGFSLTTHLINIACLYVLFMAFQQPINVGTLIAGYAMGNLFRIVSITPQGIGFVEGVMVLVYTSLGIPAAVATTVTLTFRGLTFWLPLMIGFFLIRRTRSFNGNSRTKSSEAIETKEVMHIPRG